MKHDSIELNGKEQRTRIKFHSFVSTDFLLYAVEKRKAQRNEIMLPFHSLLSFHFIIFHSFGLLPTA